MIVDILFGALVFVGAYTVVRILLNWLIYGSPQWDAADEYWRSRANKAPQPHQPGERPQDPALLGSDESREGGAGGHHG